MSHKKHVVLCLYFISILLLSLFMINPVYAETENDSIINDAIEKAKSLGNSKTIIVIDRREPIQDEVFESKESQDVESSNSNEYLKDDVPYASGDYDGDVPFLETGRSSTSHVEIGIVIVSVMFGFFIGRYFIRVYSNRKKNDEKKE